MVGFVGFRDGIGNPTNAPRLPPLPAQGILPTINFVGPLLLTAGTDVSNQIT